jgi:hypothetical protein
MTTGLSADDRLDILDVLARYNWALDTDDAEAFADTFAADGRAVMPGRTYQGRAELVEMINGLRARREAGGERNVFHVPVNIVIESVGEGRARLVTALLGPRVGEGGVAVIKHGWYDDELVKTERGWRFDRRAFRPWPDANQTGSPVPFVQ